MEEQSPSENIPPEKSANEIKENPPNDKTGDGLTEVRVDERPAKFTILNPTEDDNQPRKQAKITKKDLNTKNSARVPIQITNIFDVKQDISKMETEIIQDVTTVKTTANTEQYTTSFNKDKYIMKEKITPKNSNPLKDEEPKERYTCAKGDAEDQMVKMAGRELAW